MVKHDSNGRQRMGLCFILWRESGAIRTVVFEPIKDSLRQSEHSLTTPGGRKMRKDRIPVPRGQIPTAPRVGIETVQTGLSCSVKNSLCYIILRRNSPLASSFSE